MTEIIKSLTEMMTQNLWAAPVLSLVAGIITSFTPALLLRYPCFWPAWGLWRQTAKAVCLSLSMASGMAVTFGIFGSVASFIGHRMHEAGHWWTILMGILMILMALQVFGVISLIPHIHMSERHDKKRIYRSVFHRGSGWGVCFPLRNSGYGCPSGSGCGAGAECLVGRFTDGALCCRSQCAFGGNRNRLQLCGPGNKKSPICGSRGVAQEDSWRCDPGFWYFADLCRKIEGSTFRLFRLR